MMDRKRGFEVVAAYGKKNILLPQRKTGGSAGYDFAAAEAVLVAPRAVALIPTGIKAYMQAGEYLGLHIRSGLSVKKKLMLINGQGVIDADYYNNADNEGHIMVAVYNPTDEAVAIEAGERIAQGIFYRYLLADEDENNVAVRQGGFGSTGR